MRLNRRPFALIGTGMSVVLVAVSTVLTLGVSGPALAAQASALPDVTTNIVGGQDATIADAPWQVALITASATTEYDGQFCGGSLIATQWVVTAAHCVFENGKVSAPSSIKILAGQATLLQNANNRAVPISNIYVHPLYSSSADTDDIALIKLTSPLALVAGSIQKIDLPSAPAPTGVSDLITGWGAIADGSTNYPTALRKTTVNVLPDATCASSYSPGYDANKMLCAGSPALDRDTCQGDSGGPLARLVNTWVLEGITSFGNGCANGKDPGVYTEVYTYRSWIGQYLGGTFATTPAPTLSGTLAVGQTLEAVTGSWSPTPDSFTYVWKRAASATATSWTTITGQTTSKYLLATADRGQFIRVDVTANKAGYAPATTFKVSSAAVTAPSTTVPTPTISGTVKVGSTLTAAAGAAPTGATVKGYQWSRATTSSGLYTNIDKATASTYVLTATDVAKFIKVTVTWSQAGTADTPATSAPTSVVAAGTFATTASPTIAGTLRVGSTLTANVGTWSPAPDSYTYKWMSSAKAGGTFTAITGATAKTYVLKSTDKTKFLKVVITAVKAGYTTSAEFTSAATTAIG